MTISHRDAEAFLYHEAYLLDTRSYEEWLKLFTDDGIYWIPMYDDADPNLNASILHDDAKMRAMRVHQLINKPHYAQMPPSRTVHMISNVCVIPSDSPEEVLVRCAVFVAELREGDFQQIGLGNQRIFAGHCEYRLRQGDNFAIAMKKVMLIQRDAPIDNLSFFL